MPDLVDQFAELFAGRTDAYGSNAGGCVRQPVTRSTWERHLSGEEPIGIYPLITGLLLSVEHRVYGMDGNYVRWGCSDIDVEDLTAAVNLHKALKVLGLTSWVERSRSKGYHVWVFASEWVPAQDMRHALLLAHQLIELHPKEVNPKQVGGVELGNYVRLPYPGHWRETAEPFPDRQVVLDIEGEGLRAWLPLRWFVEHALATRNSPMAIAKAAAMYVPPRSVQAVSATALDGELSGITDKLSGKGWTIYRDGPLPGGDRSGTMLRFVAEANASGLTADEAYTLLVDVDSRWGKHYLDRPRGEELLHGIVDRIYG